MSTTISAGETSAYVELPNDIASLFCHTQYEQDHDVVEESFIYLDFNCNANIPGNVNPEFRPNEGCGCTFSYNGGAGGGTAECCDSCKPYEEGFNDKKRDSICCCESSRCYDRAGPAKTCGAKDCGPSGAAYVPDYLPTSQPRKGCESDGSAYQGGLTNKKPEGCCSPEYKYVVPNPPLPIYCKEGDRTCCGAPGCVEPDSYETICNTDAQRYKGRGPDRKNFYANDDCGCQRSNNASTVREETDWSEVRRQAYASAECSPDGAPIPLIRSHPSFCVETENYAIGCKGPQTLSNNIVSPVLPIQLTGGECTTEDELNQAVVLSEEGTSV